MKFLAEADDAVGPARSAEGRFHYDGQKALYLSLTPEGTHIASKRYFSPNDSQRGIFSIDVTDARIVDLRDNSAARALGIDTAHRACEWQDYRAQGERAPTWDISDGIRAISLDGILYASRTDPSKTHLTLFRWNTPGTAQVRHDGTVLPFLMG